MRSWMIALLECSVSMTAVGLLYMAAAPFLQKRIAAKGRYYAWLTIVIGLLIPLRFHLPMPVVSVEALLPALENAGRSSPDQAVSPAAATAAAFPWHALAGGIWAAGVIVFAAGHAIRHRRLLRMVKRWSAECSDRQALRLLRDIQANMNITRQVGLRICPGVISPMLVGFVRPVILLPSDPIPAHELPFILKHELIHLKRGDLVYKMLVFAATALHWFNPFVYRMAREIALQCELSCDEEVVKHADANHRRQYVEAIIGVMKKQSRAQSAFSTSFSDSRLSMKIRVLAIMDTRSKKWGISLLAVIILATIGTGAVFKLGSAKFEAATPESATPVTTIGSVTPEPTAPMTAFGRVAEQEAHKPSASSADPASPAGHPEGRQRGTAPAPGIPERGAYVAGIPPLLVPVPAAEGHTSIPVSREAEREGREENKPKVPTADPASSGDNPEGKRSGIVLVPGLQQE